MKNPPLSPIIFAAKDAAAITEGSSVLIGIAYFCPFIIKFKPKPIGNEITPMQFSTKLSARNKFNPPVFNCSMSTLLNNFFICNCLSIIFFFLNPLQIKLLLLLLLLFESFILILFLISMLLLLI